MLPAGTRLYRLLLPKKIVTQVTLQDLRRRRRLPLQLPPLRPRALEQSQTFRLPRPGPVSLDFRTKMMIFVTQRDRNYLVLSSEF